MEKIPTIQEVFEKLPTVQEAYFERLIELNITRKELEHEMQARKVRIDEFEKAIKLLKGNEKRYAELEIMKKYLDEHLPVEPYTEAEMKEIKRLIKRDMRSIVENISSSSCFASLTTG